MYLRKCALILPVLSVAFSACLDEKDLYDPEYKTSNPLENVTAPANFDWKAFNSIPVTVKVNDEFLGAYHYTVEVFDDNPFWNENATLLSKGFAKMEQDFENEIVVLADQELVYIRQTDPRGRSVVTFAEVGKTISCDFSEVDAQPETRSFRGATRANEIRIPDYSENSPEFQDAIEFTSSITPSVGKTYKISAGKTISQGLGNGGANSKLFIQGKWTGGNQIPNDWEIIVLDGGVWEPNGGLTGGWGALNLAVMPGGKVISSGNFNATSGTADMYILGDMDVAGEIKPSEGTSSMIYIGSGATVNAERIRLPNNSTYLENHGTINVDEFTSNSGHLSLYNACAINIKKDINLQRCIYESYKGILRAPSLDVTQAQRFVLTNGSMVHCTGKMILTSANITAVGPNRSLVKVGELDANAWSTKSIFSGPVTLEAQKLTRSNCYTLSNGAQQAEYGKSNVLIVACTGEGNGGNPGKDPEEPEFPIDIPNRNTYTIFYEDNWPLYGDYDANDVVLKLTNMVSTLNGLNRVSKLTFEVKLEAVGGEKRVAAAMMFDNIDATNIKSVSYSITGGNEYTTKPTTFKTTASGVEEGQSRAVIPLFDEVHKFMGRPDAWYVNTIASGDGSVDNVSNPPTMKVVVEFNTSVESLALNINNMNFFIITDIKYRGVTQSGRREIHPIGYQPTDKGETAVFGNHNDNSSVSAGRYYTSKDHLAWGVIVPAEFKWPIELINITDAYPDFTGWVTSGGVNNTRWWENYNSSKVFK